MRVRSSFSCRPPEPLICPAFVIAFGARRNSVMFSTQSKPARPDSSRSSHGENPVSLISSLANSCLLAPLPGPAPPRPGRSRPGRNPVVDHPGAEMMVVDPVRHRRIVLVGHQQRQREAAQQPLGGTFPGRLLRADLDQLAGERQLGLGRCSSRQSSCRRSRLRLGMLLVRDRRLTSSAFSSAAWPWATLASTAASVRRFCRSARCWLPARRGLVDLAAAGAELARRSRPAPSPPLASSSPNRSALRIRSSPVRVSSASRRSISLRRSPPWPARSKFRFVSFLRRPSELFFQPGRAGSRLRPGLLQADSAGRAAPACGRRSSTAAPPAGRSAAWISAPTLSYRVTVGEQRRSSASWACARRTASCALVRSSKCATRRRSRMAASKGSSMWLRTKSLRLPTDFIDTVWWNSSMACSDSMPRRRRKSLP